MKATESKSTVTDHQPGNGVGELRQQPLVALVRALRERIGGNGN
jgi:hypothetical protein